MAEKLFTPQVNAIDLLKGSALSALSAVACVLPDKANFIGYSDSESYMAVRWQHLGRTAHSIGGEWIEYEGVESSGIAPKNYGDVALVGVDREEMDKLQEFTGGRHAVVYRLGSTTMMGYSSKNEILSLENDEDDVYWFAMRRGKGPLDISVGTDINAPGGSVFRAAFNSYTPLKRGVIKGQTIPTPLVPSFINLL